MYFKIHVSSLHLYQTHVWKYKCSTHQNGKTDCKVHKEFCIEINIWFISILEKYLVVDFQWLKYFYKSIFFFWKLKILKKNSVACMTCNSTSGCNVPISTIFSGSFAKWSDFKCLVGVGKSVASWVRSSTVTVVFQSNQHISMH